MKHLFVALTSLTLLMPLSTEAQPQQGQNPGGGNSCSPQHMNNPNEMDESDYLGPDPGIDRHASGNNDPGMERRMNSSLDPGISGGGTGADASGSRNFNQSDSFSNMPPGGGSNFRGFRGGPGGQGNPPTDFAERRARMIKRFDTNGDGVLDDAERAKMRAFMQQRRQEMQNRANSGEGGERGGWDARGGEGSNGGARDGEGGDRGSWGARGGNGGTTEGPPGGGFPQNGPPGGPPDGQ